MVQKFLIGKLPICTGLLRTNGEFDIFSSNHRRSSSIADRANDNKVHRDIMFQRMIAAVGHKCANVNEAAAKMLHAMKYDRLEGGKELSSGNISNRVDIVKKSGLITGKLRDAFVKLHDEYSDNSGNTSSSHAATVSTIKFSDTALSELAKSGAKFFVQGEGSADPKGPTMPAGPDGTTMPFIVPADGTILKSEPGSKCTNVAFRRSVFVSGITYRGLETRVKKEGNSKLSGKTKHTKSIKFDEYTLRPTAGIMRYTTRVFRYLNDCNVVEVCLMKSSEVTTTVSGRKKGSSNEYGGVREEINLAW